jgi:hypothetical protein
VIVTGGGEESTGEVDRIGSRKTRKGAKNGEIPPLHSVPVGMTASRDEV